PLSSGLSSDLRIPAASRSSTSPRRPDITTVAPLAAKAFAPPSPIPVPAPVTHASLPLNEPIRSSSLIRACVIYRAAECAESQINSPQPPLCLRREVVEPL